MRSRTMPLSLEELRDRGRSRGGADQRARRPLSRRRHAGDARRQRRRSVVLDAGAHRRPRADAAGGLRASGIVIGAGVTYAALLAEREFAFLHPVARSIGGPAVRNMGTIGGNLFAPAPFGDFAAALLALDATVQLQGGYSPARNADRGVSRLARAASEGARCCRSRCRARPAPRRSAISKVARVKPKGASVLTIAAHIPLSGGRVAGARIAFGSMGATPLRAKSAERALEGRPLDAATHRRRRRRRAGRPGAGRRRAGERLVSARGRRRPPAAPAERRGVTP